MDFPKLREVGNESLDTLALIGGVTLAKVASSLIKKTGVVPSAAILLGGFALSYYAPKSLDKFKVKSMAKGIQAFGGMGLISELSKDTINLGINGIAGINGVSEIKNPIPANIRKYIADNVPTINGVDIPYLNGVDDYINNRNSMPVESLNVNSLFAA